MRKEKLRTFAFAMALLMAVSSVDITAYAADMQNGYAEETTLDTGNTVTDWAEQEELPLTENEITSDEPDDAEEDGEAISDDITNTEEQEDGILSGEVLTEDTAPDAEINTEETIDTEETIVNTDYGLSNPRKDASGNTIWDCVWFGNYWQNDTNGDGTADTSDNKEPVKWRVLSVSGDQALLLADKNLDGKQYNAEYADVTWETCTMRSWLNGYGADSNVQAISYTNDSFIGTAFTTAEKNAIAETTLVNADNADYGTEGGNNTTDRVFLLSLDDVVNTAYGFNSNMTVYDTARRAANTDFAKSQGAWTGTSSIGEWWLRSPGGTSHGAACVYYSGFGGSGYGVDFDIRSVRPALYLNLSSFVVWSGAGTVCSDGTVEETTFEYSYIAGKLTAVDETNAAISLDDNVYPVANTLSMNRPKQILESEGNVLVVCTLRNEEITDIIPVKDLLKPQIIFVKGEDIVYENGYFSADTKEVQVRVSCGVRDKAYKDVLKQLEGAGIQVEKLSITVPEGVFNLGETGIFNKTKITTKEEKINQTLAVDDMLVYDYTLYLEEDYTPPAKLEAVNSVDLVFTIDGEEISFTGEVPVQNLDFRKQRAEELKAQRESASKVSTAKQELQKLCNGSTLALSKDLSYYFDEKQIKEIEEYLYVWLAEVNNANTYTDDDETNKKIMEKLGINPNVGFLWLTTKATTQVVAETVYGKRTFEFVLTLGTLQSNGTSYGSFGDITYEVIEKDDIPNKVPTEGTLGMTTYVSMENFIKCLQEVAESSIKDVYKGIWGSKADAIASIVVDETILKIIDKKYGSFSNGVYTLITKPTKNYIKKVKIECPVDVYVYNMDDTLCGAIVDNVVDPSYSDIAMCVDGDAKIFYLIGDAYKVKLVGNDTGTMTYTIEELGEDMSSLRTVQFKDIPLTDGKTYNGYITEQPYIDNALYALETEDGDIITADTDTYQDNLPKRVYVDGIQISVSEQALKVGESFALSASVTPENATNQKFQWKSSDEKIAAVDETGKVTAVKEGSAVIKCISDDGEFEDSCRIIITPCMLTLDANGGAFEKGSSISESRVYGECVGEIMQPLREGYSFTGWFTAKDGGEEITKDTKVTGDIIIYAQWKEISEFMVTFDANGGKIGDSDTSVTVSSDGLTAVKTVVSNKPYGALPFAGREHYEFLGWFTTKDDTKESKAVSENALFTESADQTLYAHWKLKTYTLTFDGCGGKLTAPDSSVQLSADGLKASKTIASGQEYGSFAIAAREGFLFVGWYTKPEGGEPVTEKTVCSLTKDAVIYAQWNYITLVEKQKIEIKSFFEKEIQNYLGEDTKKKQYKYAVTKVATITGNKGSASVSAKTGILTAKRSGVVEIRLMTKNLETKKWETSDKYLTVVIEKPVVKKVSMTYVGQQINVDEFLSYQGKEYYSNEPNYCDISYEVTKPKAGKPEIASVDAKGNLTAVSTGTTKLTITYTNNYGAQKPSVVKKTVSISVKVPKFSKETLTVAAGKTGSNALKNVSSKSQSVTYSVDKTWAQIDAKGKVKVLPEVASGETATVTATVKETSGKEHTYSYQLRVK